MFVLPARITAILGFALIAATLLVFSAPRPAYANQIEVTTTDDEFNGVSGDGDCSLREAVFSANEDTSVDDCAEGNGFDEVTLPGANYNLIFGDLELYSSVRIKGAATTRPVINGADTDRVFTVTSDFAALQHVEVFNGQSPASENGGGMLVMAGAGIQIDDVLFNGNTSSGVGGGLYNAGTVTLSDVQFFSNNALGGIGGNAVANAGADSIFNGFSMIFDGNGTSPANAGGTFAIDGGNVGANALSFTNNNSLTVGGAIKVISGEATITNTTIAANEAAGASAVYVQSGELALGFVTIAGNPENGAASIQAAGGVIEFRNSIVGNGDTCLELGGDIQSIMNNLEEGDTCGFHEDGDIPNGNAGLESLADNGGTNGLSRALLPESQALGAFEPGNCIPTDQRGVVRPLGNECDLGAFESELFPAPTITPAPTASPTPVPTTPAPTSSPTETPVATASPTESAAPSPTATSGTQQTLGDSDCSGSIGARDNQALLRNVLGQTALSQTEPCPDLGTGGPPVWGDWDCNGAISARDNQALLRFVLQQAPLSQTEPCTDIGDIG